MAAKYRRENGGQGAILRANPFAVAQWIARRKEATGTGGRADKKCLQGITVLTVYGNSPDPSAFATFGFDLPFASLQATMGRFFVL
jgi:hypothetical protein